MAATKVLVVDDSLTMRALISRALDGIPGVDVVGAADGAAEARVEVARLKPDVMTLDIEMPGMSGIEYLAEIMSTKPMPVIMFSTLTEAGASASVEALRLGAVDCFPKPKVATQGEFDVILAKLGKCIRTAKAGAQRQIKVDTTPPVAGFDWNGRMLAIGADASATQSLFGMLGALPENCPPTVIVSHVRRDLVDSIVDKMKETAKPKVVKAEDGMALEQGTVYFAGPGDAHVVLDKWPDGRLRFMPRDPIVGERPSISLLFASFAKATAAETIGVLLTAGGEDGQAGIKAILAAGGHIVGPSAPGADGTSTGFTLYKGMASQPVEGGDVLGTALKLCSK